MIGLHLKDLRRHFRSPVARSVLNGIEVNITPGEFVGLVGPSGVGKTTLLRIIAGLDRDFEGTLAWSESRQPSMGMVFQEPRLVPWLTIIENLLLVTREDARPEAMALMAQVELAGCEDSLPAQLSGGMQRRAALARALLTKPDLLLLDEPFISLDRACAERIRLRLTEYWKIYQPTIIMVTHDLAEAAELSSRIIALAPNSGQIAFDRQITVPYPRLLTDATVTDLLEDLRSLSQDWTLPKAEAEIDLRTEHHADSKSNAAYRPLTRTQPT